MDFFDFFNIFSVFAVPVILLVFLVLIMIFIFRGGIGKLKLNDVFGERVKIVGEGNNVSLGAILGESEGIISTENKITLLLEEYHNQGLLQSRISFWFSIVSASMGFLVILYSIYLFIAPDNSIQITASSDVSIVQNSEPRTWLDEAGTPFFTLICGVIIDAVAGLFFVQSNKARQLMSEFFDRLRIDRKLDESLKMINSIEDKGIAGRAQALLAINLAEIQIDGPVYQRVITGQYKKNMDEES